MLVTEFFVQIAPPFCKIQYKVVLRTVYRQVSVYRVDIFCRLLH